jgi:hypothetical protein
MRKLILLLTLALLPNLAVADNCRVTTATLTSGTSVKVESVTVCKEGEIVSPRIRVGDTILETEVGNSNVDVAYFKHNNTRCRLFSERLTESGKLRVNHGVICQIDNSPTNWLVIDKW